MPLRDMFAAIFFFWFGLTIAPSDMGAIAPAVIVAVVVTLAFNVIAGVVAARIYGYGRHRGLQHRVDAGQPRRVRADPRLARGRRRARPPGRRRSPRSTCWCCRSCRRCSPRARTCSRGWLPRRLFAPCPTRAASARDRAARSRSSRSASSAGSAPRRSSTRCARLRHRRRARARSRPAARCARQRDRPRRRGGRAARLDAASAPAIACTSSSGGRSRREVEALQERWRTGPMGPPPRPRRKLRGDAADLHRPPVRRARR